MYVQSETLLLDDVFINLQNSVLKYMGLILFIIFSKPGLAWQADLKKTKVKLDLLTDIDIVSMEDKCIIGGICRAIHRYVKANNKYMKNYDKNKESPYLKFWDVNNLYGSVMSQKLSVDIFLNLIFNILQNSITFTKIFHFS